MIKKRQLSLSILTLLLASGSVFAKPSVTAKDGAGYDNLFVAYFSPKDVQSMQQYANSQGLGGYILWDVKGDTDPSTQADTSLLKALNPDQQLPGLVMSYWTNWSVYSKYPIPGSVGDDGAATNQDLSDKLPYLNTLAYAFFEAQSTTDKAPGTLYFSDPWSDLLPTDSFCQNGANPVCSYVPNSQGKPYDGSTKMGNFEAFALLPQQYKGLQTAISVGGAGHDATFESTFTPGGNVNADYVNNFVNSATSILNNYKVAGIDLDYENPNMTLDQSRSFQQLITALDSKLGSNQFITVTILANPEFINGTEQGGAVGFAPGVLKAIAALSHVKSINVMTYDFHGAFDYNPADTSQGRTGFLTNNFMPNNAPANYNPRFSVDTSVNALQQAGVPNNKIVVGIPTYGRALANVSPGDDNTGLFQPITSNVIVPQGDMDNDRCSQTLPLAPNACSGAFSYQYIVGQMLNNGVTATDWTNDSGNQYNGSTGFAQHWQPGQTGYMLEVTNTNLDKKGPAFGFNVTDGNDSFNGGGYYLNPGDDNVYTTDKFPGLSAIEHKTGLSVTWTDYTGTYACSGTFDFNANYHIMINTGTEHCQISEMPTSK